jgi:hypothetical protein
MASFRGMNQEREKHKLHFCGIWLIYTWANRWIVEMTSKEDTESSQGEGESNGVQVIKCRIFFEVLIKQNWDQEATTCLVKHYLRCYSIQKMNTSSQKTSVKWCDNDLLRTRKESGKACIPRCWVCSGMELTKFSPISLWGLLHCQIHDVVREQPPAMQCVCKYTCHMHRDISRSLWFTTLGGEGWSPFGVFMVAEMYFWFVE